MELISGREFPFSRKCLLKPRRVGQTGMKKCGWRVEEDVSIMGLTR
jgi:hypothetical protein